MTEEIKILVQYRMSRAKESIEEAKLLINNGHINAYINRLYYACFYAVNSLLLSKGLSSAKHSGIRSLFHQNIIKNGILDVIYGKHYDRLYDNRQKGDYVDLVSFKAEDVSKWFDDAIKFVNQIESIIKIEIE